MASPSPQGASSFLCLQYCAGFCLHEPSQRGLRYETPSACGNLLAAVWTLVTCHLWRERVVQQFTVIVVMSSSGSRVLVLLRGMREKSLQEDDIAGGMRFGYLFTINYNLKVIDLIVYSVLLSLRTFFHTSFLPSFFSFLRQSLTMQTRLTLDSQRLACL